MDQDAAIEKNLYMGALIIPGAPANGNLKDFLLECTLFRV